MTEDGYFTEKEYIPFAFSDFERQEYEKWRTVGLPLMNRLIKFMNSENECTPEFHELLSSIYTEFDKIELNGHNGYITDISTVFKAEFRSYLDTGKKPVNSMRWFETLTCQYRREYSYIKDIIRYNKTYEAFIQNRESIDKFLDDFGIEIIQPFPDVGPKKTVHDLTKQYSIDMHNFCDMITYWLLDFDPNCWAHIGMQCDSILKDENYLYNSDGTPERRELASNVDWYCFYGISIYFDEVIESHFSDKKGIYEDEILLWQTRVPHGTPKKLRYTQTSMKKYMFMLCELFTNIDLENELLRAKKFVETLDGTKVMSDNEDKYADPVHDVLCKYYFIEMYVFPI